MASILKVKGLWRAQVRKAGHASTAQSFPTRAEALKWARKVEADFDKGKPLKPSEVTVSDMIAHYRQAREKSGRPINPKSNEHYMLNNLAAAFPGEKVATLKSQRIVAYAQARRKSGVGGYTVNMEISKLGTVIRHTSSLLDLDLPDCIGKARPLLHHLHLIGQGGERDRRPTADEIGRLFAWFAANPQYGLPMVDVVKVAMQCALRRGEVFRILWSDLDIEKRLILVRDRKDPRRKVGNHELVPLVGDSLDVIMRQRRVDVRIFPHEPGTASKYFKWACDACGIKDLRLHDLRHEATSALFEAGWNVPEVAVVTGHKDWRNLKRYTNLDPAKVAKKGQNAG